MAKKSTNETLTETPFAVVFFFSKFLQIAEKILQMVSFTPTSSLEKNGYYNMFHFHISFKYEARLAWLIRSARAAIFLRLKNWTLHYLNSNITICL